MDEGRDGTTRGASTQTPPGRDRRRAPDRRFTRRSAAHDARLALATVRALLATQVEREPQLPRDVVACLSEAAREVDRVTVLLNPDIGRPDVHRCDVAAIAHDVAGVQARRWGVPVTCRGGSVYAAGDATTLWRVLTNLVHNACRAAGRAGRVSVTVALGDHSGCVVVRVRDDGPGCSSPWRAGIGLGVVGRLLEDLGGRYEAAPARDGGTEIRVTLPAGTRASATTGVGA